MQLIVHSISNRKYPLTGLTEIGRLVIDSKPRQTFLLFNALSIQVVGDHGHPQILLLEYLWILLTSCGVVSHCFLYDSEFRVTLLDWLPPEPKSLLFKPQLEGEVMESYICQGKTRLDDSTLRAANCCIRRTSIHKISNRNLKSEIDPPNPHTQTLTYICVWIYLN